jgi:hypothetical protein
LFVVIFAGQLIAGGVVSLTVKVVTQVVLLFEPSFTVTVIVVVPVPTSVPAAGFCVTTNSSEGVQLSDASTPSITLGTDA